MLALFCELFIRRKNPLVNGAEGLSVVPKYITGYMVFLRKKIINGTAYWALVRNHRSGHQTTQTSVSLGPPNELPMLWNDPDILGKLEFLRLQIKLESQKTSTIED